MFGKYKGILLGVLLITVLLSGCMARQDEIYFDTLCHAEIFVQEEDPGSGKISEDVEAFYQLCKSKYALWAFKKLEQEGTDAGKLYALCALYQMDYDYYFQCVQKYTECERLVSVRNQYVVVQKRMSYAVSQLIPEKLLVHGAF